MSNYDIEIGYTEYLTNMYDETATVTVNEDYTATVKLEDGQTKTFEDFDAAIERLYRMGYRF